jgi:probable HAF family extracellular repeat protein
MSAEGLGEQADVKEMFARVEAWTGPNACVELAIPTLPRHPERVLIHEAHAALGMNDAGDAVGNLLETATDGSLNYRPFLLRADGTVAFIEFAGASNIFTTDVNDAGQVTGAFSDPTGTVHGFIWHEGQVVFLDVPGSGLTQPNGINDRGEVVGVYVIPEGYRGFRYAAGRYTTIHYRRGIGSVASKIDDRGRILGEYYPATGNPGYFVAIPEGDDDQHEEQ